MSLSRIRAHAAPRTSSAFTLVELLVVVGIIAVLVSLLLPAVKGAKSRAQLLMCSSNLRQIGVAVAHYASQNMRKLPYGGTPNFGWPDEGFVRAWELLGKDIPQKDFFICPADFEPAWNVWWMSPAAYGGQSGVKMVDGSPLVPPFPNSYYYHFANYHRFTWDGTTNYHGDQPSQMLLSDIKYPARRCIISCRSAEHPPGTGHGAGINMLFGDFHVQWVRPDECANGVMGAQQLGYPHVDWTINGLAGFDLK